MRCLRWLEHPVDSSNLADCPSPLPAGRPLSIARYPAWCAFFQERGQSMLAFLGYA